MNRHVGASFTLSVLLVGFFAVVLYQPDGPPPAPNASLTSTETGPEPVPRDARPAPTPGLPLTESSFERSSGEPERFEASTLFPSPSPPRLTRAAGFVTAGSSRETPDDSAPAAPTSRIDALARRRPVATGGPSFTQVGEGESLFDVAARVYGTRDAAGALWLANRDIIDRREAPLRRGMLLRTP